MRYWIFLLGIILFCYEPSVAQNKKTKTIAKKVEKTIAKPQPSESILFQTMLQNADKIMVIDSVVVDKDDFIKTALFLYAYRFIVRKDKVSLIVRFFYVFLH